MGLKQLFLGRAGRQQRGAFTLGPLLLLGLFTAFTLLALTTLSSTALGGLSFEAFTLGLLLFTLAFTAFTGLPLGTLPSLRPLVLLTPRGLFPRRLFTEQPGLVLALFTRLRRSLLARLPLAPLGGLPAGGGSFFPLALLGLLPRLVGGQGGGDGPPVGEPGLRRDDQQQRSHRVHGHSHQVLLQRGVGHVQGEGHGPGHPPQHHRPPATVPAKAGEHRVEADHDHDRGVHHQGQDRRRPPPLLGRMRGHQRGDGQDREEHRAADDQPRSGGQGALR